MYEWTRCFQPDPNAENGVCRERKLLWAMANGRFYPQIGVARVDQSIPCSLRGWSKSLEFCSVTNSDWHHLTLKNHLRSSFIQDAVRRFGSTTRVGVLGEVHPNVRSRLKLKKNRPCYFEIELDALLDQPDGQRYTLPPIHQPLVRTLAFALPPRIEADAVGHLLGQEGASVSIVDEFCYEDSDRMMRAITFELSYPNPNGNLSTDTVNTSLQTLIQLVETNLGEQGFINAELCVALASLYRTQRACPSYEIIICGSSSCFWECGRAKYETRLHHIPLTVLCMVLKW